jgi:ATP-dependent Clp protease ATP-binding subunit ClpC
MGFGAAGGVTTASDYEKMRERLEEHAKKHFKPEFLNRIDEIVVFRQLERIDLATIVNLEVAKIQERLSGRELELVLTEEAREFLIDKGFKPEYGARQLRRVVERYIEDPLAEEILKGAFNGPRKINVGVADDKLTFRSRKKPAPKKEAKEA